VTAAFKFVPFVDTLPQCQLHDIHQMCLSSPQH